MNTIPTIRQFAPEEWRIYRDLRLQALAESPDAFGRTLSEEQGRSDAEWSARLAPRPGSDLPLVAEVRGEPIGLAWGRIGATPPDTAHLYQMWVAASHRKLGAGRMLLDAVIRWAITANARWMALHVACGDTPAMRLYSSAGFKLAGDPEPLRLGSASLAQPMRLELSGRVNG